MSEVLHVLNRELLGLEAALDGLDDHYERWGYSGPLVFAHDSTAVRPYADVRVVDADLVDLSCFISDPVRLPLSEQGAIELCDLTKSSTPKVGLRVVAQASSLRRGLLDT